MEFKWYVLNYDINSKQVENFNVFKNSEVNKYTEKAVKKYLRSPSKFKYLNQYGFEAFVAEIDSIIKWQEWSRREYEISVSDAFVTEISDVVNKLDKYTDLDTLKNDLITQAKMNPRMEKWDCYQQCKPNMKEIAYTVIRQYKEQLKAERDNNDK